MKNVLVCSMLEGTGGIEEFVMNLSRYKNDYDVKYDYVVIGEKSVYYDEIIALGRKCYFISPKKKILLNILGWIELLYKNRKKYDIIYFNVSGFYYALPYVLGKIFGYNIVLHAHNTKDISRKSIVHSLHYLNRFYIRRFTKHHYACSMKAGEWIYGKKYCNKKVQVIPNAINLSKFTRSNNQKDYILKNLNIENKFVIGNIARLSKVKNQQFLIKIFYEYIKFNPNAILLLVGDGECKQDLQDMVRQLNIEEHVIFYGNSKTPEIMYECFDCFVLPSLNEGFPITLVEAQAMGLKCFVSDNVTPEVNITNNIRYISLDESPQRWAEIIYKSDCTYYEAIEEMKQKGYEISMMVNQLSSKLDAI